MLNRSLKLLNSVREIVAAKTIAYLSGFAKALLTASAIALIKPAAVSDQI
jgi:hypothetical protein